MWSLPLVFLTVLVIYYYGSFVVRFCFNYIDGRKSGFYTILIPFAPAHPVWLIGSGVLRTFLQRTLRGPLWDYLVVTVGPLEHEIKRAPFVKSGSKSYLLVTAGKNELWTADPEVIIEVLKRPKDFSQQDISNYILGHMGPSLITSDGASWSKQRKIVASVINERISKLVFEESLRQAFFLGDELKTLSKDANVTLPSMEGMKKIAINVLSRAGYGIPKAWEDDDAPSESVSRGGRYHMDFMSSVKYMIDYLVPAAFMSPQILINMPSWVPGAEEMHRIGHAVKEYPYHARARIAEERALLASSKSASARPSLLAQLVLNSADAAQDTEKAALLTEPEMFGNLFVFTAAGFDTTANTLQFATMLLAAYPEWQDWLHEESKRLFPSGVNPSELDYASTFTKAPRHLALMNETLRLFPPVPHNAKENKSGKTMTVKTSESTFQVPAGTNIFPCFLALHLEPKVWRNLNRAGYPQPTPQTVKETLQDALEKTQDEYNFRPARWILPASTQLDGVEELFKPPQGYFLPFSTGPRVCPGYKMAQVEFVAVMLTILRRYKVEAIKIDIDGRQESEQETAQRFWEIMHDLKQGVTISIKRIGEAGLRFIEREV
ncbi:Cytochrome P450-like protein 78 [Elsinoe fawcettii]|nr:Cytochrome P450-like protein 78 [Elsinoe fawcettii]